MKSLRAIHILILVMCLILASACSEDSASSESLSSSTTTPLLVGGDDASLPIGEEVELTWDVSLTDISIVQVEVSYDGGATWTVIEERIENQGNYSWQVPRIPGATVRLRISDADNSETVIAETGDITLSGEVDTQAPNIPRWIAPSSDVQTSQLVYLFQWDSVEDNGDAGLKEYVLTLFEEENCGGPSVSEATHSAEKTPLEYEATFTNRTVNSLQLEAVDWVGNRSKICSHAISIDIHIPEIVASDSGSAPGYTQSQNINLSLGNDSSAHHWCVTEDASFEPTQISQDCPDGQGTGAGGWHDSRPTSYGLGATEGAKTIYVWLADENGQVLNRFPGVYEIIYDATPPATFSIDGLSGTGDSKLDAFVSGTNAEIQWQTSTDAVSYEVSIYDSTGTHQLCGPFNVSAPTTKQSIESCNLVDGTTYQAQVTAKDAALNELGPITLNFEVDLTAPSSFTISGVSGGADSNTDQWMSSSTPTITYTNASDEFRYLISIKNMDDSLLCQQEDENADVLSHDYSLSSAGVCQSLTHGEDYKVSVIAEDQAGNSTVADNNDLIVTADLENPEVTITSHPNSLVSVTNADFQFTTSDGLSGVQGSECQLNSGSFVSCTSPHGYTGLSEAAHQFTVRVTDRVGLQATKSYSWTVDTSAPVLTLTSQPPSLGNSTNPQVVFTVADVSTTTIECQLNSAGYSACSSPAAFSVAQGSHSIDVRATDGLNQSTVQTANFTVDTTAPTVSLTSTPAALSTTDTASFSFTTADTGGGAVAATECQLDSGGYSSCTSPHSVNSLSDGNHEVDIRAVDTAGNIGPASSHSWNVDANPPVSTITANPASVTSSTSASFTFNVVDGGTVASIECRIDSGSWTSCSSPQNYSGLSGGSHTFEVRGTDGFANVGSPDSYTWTIDLTGPTSSITSSPASGTNSTSASFVFSASDTGGGSVASYECQLDGGGYSTCTSPRNFTSLTQGSYSFEVRAIDSLGNVGSAEVHNWFVDTTAPTVTINSHPSSLTNSTSASFGVSGNDTGGGSVASYECQLNGGGFVACTTTPNYTGLSQGAQTFQIRPTDSVGNTGTTQTYNWTIDTTGPTTTIGSSSVGSTSPSFSFSAVDSGGSSVSYYQCSLSGVQSWTTCTSSKAYSGVGSGSYTFSVRAVDAVGNVGASDTYTWANGGWTAFGSWGSCSASCGGGTQYRYRSCTNPSPSNGGYGCSGSSSSSQSCNTHSCLTWTYQRIQSCGNSIPWCPTTPAAGVSCSSAGAECKTGHMFCEIYECN